MSHGGVRGVRVAVLSNIEQQVTKTGQGKLDGTSAYNIFSYSNEALTIWKEFDMGSGRKLSWTTMQGT